MDKATLQVVVDTIFGVVESKESGLALTLTQALQRAVDANLDQILALVQGKLGK